MLWWNKGPALHKVLLQPEIPLLNKDWPFLGWNWYLATWHLIWSKMLTDGDRCIGWSLSDLNDCLARQLSSTALDTDRGKFETACWRSKNMRLLSGGTSQLVKTQWNPAVEEGYWWKGNTLWWKGLMWLSDQLQWSPRIIVTKVSQEAAAEMKTMEKVFALAKATGNRASHIWRQWKRSEDQSQHQRYALS